MKAIEFNYNNGRYVGTAYIEHNKSIRLVGKYGRDKNFDIKFDLGSNAEYDSYNLSYVGVITKITEKTVTVRNSFFRNNKRMKLEEFVWRNWDFDLDQINKRNAEISQQM